MFTLDDEDIRNISDHQLLNEGQTAGLMAIALLANTLSTGSNEIIDNHPKGGNSTVMRIVNHFILLATYASLAKKGILEIKFEDDKFFNFEVEGIYTRLKERHEIPDEYKDLYDYMNPVK
jgi:hypothetical protein